MWNLAIPAIGAVAGLLGSRRSRQPTTQTSGPPEWMQPYQQGFLDRARDQSMAPYQGYTGEGVAPLNNDQTEAIGAIRDLARNGDPLVNRGRLQQQNVIDGGMLGQNPFIDQVASGIADRMGEGYATGTRGALTSGAQLSGNDPRYSSGYAQAVGNSDRAFGDALGQTMSGLYYGNYRDERGAQDAAARSSLAFAQNGRTNFEGLLNAGGVAQANEQAGNQFDYSQFLDQRGYPQQQLANYGTALSGNYGQTSRTSQPGVSPFLGAVGGGLAAAGAARSIFGPSMAPTGGWAGLLGGSQQRTPGYSPEMIGSMGWGD